MTKVAIASIILSASGWCRTLVLLATVLCAGCHLTIEKPFERPAFCRGGHVVIQKKTLKDNMYLATSLFELNELNHATLNQVSLLELKNKIVFLPKYTSVIVLRTEDTASQVQVIGGDDDGLICWINTNVLEIPDYSEESEIEYGSVHRGQHGTTFSQCGFTTCYCSESVFSDCVIRGLDEGVNQLIPRCCLKIASNRKVYLASLLRSGQASQLPNGTLITVTDKGGPMRMGRKVKVNAGPLLNRTYWLSAASLIPSQLMSVHELQNRCGDTPSLSKQNRPRTAPRSRCDKNRHRWR